MNFPDINYHENDNNVKQFRYEKNIKIIWNKVYHDEQIFEIFMKKFTCDQ